jgi:muramoyltetrapeptide carboxypeptidase LdcA involved in peptidoglycan recycling
MVLFIETSENMPHEGNVGDLVRCLGIRGLLRHVVAVLVALPKVEFLGQRAQPDPETYRAKQKAAVLQRLEEYRADAESLGFPPPSEPVPVIFNLHAGHVDPQLVIPLGRECVLDLSEHRLFFNYGAAESFEEFCAS